MCVHEILEQVRALICRKKSFRDYNLETSEFEEMLMATRPELIPTLVLGGFGRIRTAEINRLDWADIDLEKKIVKIMHQKQN